MNGTYKVGELSRLFGISTDTLRYYEDIGVLVPRRAENNYRVYRTEDVWKLNVIRDLRDLDFPIEIIRDYLQTRSIDSTLQIMNEELAMIDQKICHMNEIKENLLRRKHAICDAREEAIGEIRLRRLAARACHRILQGYETDVEMDVLMKKLINFDKEKLYIIGNNQMGSFIGMEKIKAKKFNSYDSVFVFHEKGEYQIQAGDYLTVCYHGACTQNADFIPALLDYAQQHGLICCGPVLELMW
ncbi:MAG: MerR family transcriptional regulator, partial [Pygmaiobacter sp.]